MALPTPHRMDHEVIRADRRDTRVAVASDISLLGDSSSAPFLQGGCGCTSEEHWTKGDQSLQRRDVIDTY